jgi:2,4-dienoyl-CoA reductase-like NADH-dependent reductase (Old Yellow Enzyme family)
LVINETNLAEIAALRQLLVDEHLKARGKTADLLIGMQLTHSGRWARPNRKDTLEPLVAYHHPNLDARHADQPGRVLTDDEIDFLVDDFVRAGVLAAKAGFDFVDIKHCHGYLGHELLSAIGRPGKYGGSLENRARFLVAVAEGLRAEVPGLLLGMRLSIYDSVPFRKGADGTGVPEQHSGASYGFAFGGDGTGTGFALEEPAAFLRMARDCGVSMICTTAGSPYYSPHLQRPAAVPPSDGYLPPEDPLAGVARQVEATAWLKSHVPGLAWVGSGYTYLQEWLGLVGQGAVRRGMVDSVGLGRMALSYPDLPADLLDGRPFDRRKICRTFSDCTSAPRRGMVSGCYPLDPLYRERPEALVLRQARQRPA